VHSYDNDIADVDNCHVGKRDDEKGDEPCFLEKHDHGDSPKFQHLKSLKQPLAPIIKRRSRYFST
jgi:hypothetical protein